MAKTTVGLYYPQISNLNQEIKSSLDAGFDLVVGPIVNSLFRREFSDELVKANHQIFSRSDLLLESNDWLCKVISKVTESIDCDSKNEQIRKHSEQILMQELAFADHLIQYGYVLIRLKNGNSMNFARIISRNVKGTILMEVPMKNPSITSMAYRKQSTTLPDEPEDPWNWWNRFRYFTDFNPKICLALEVSEDVPSSEMLQRWLCEPVLCLIIPSTIFIRNAQNYPVLSKGHQAVVAAFIKNNISFLVKCNAEDRSMRYYVDYLKHLGTIHTNIKDPMNGLDDVLEIPLQPLYDNLDSYTYEVFEKDPVKYFLYQKAIERALIDKVPRDQIDKRTIVLMVVGAGRGPIVRAALNAAANTERKCRVYIVEKNPNAVITLTALIEELWPDKDIQLISCDMRDLKPPEKVDILVSELLGSFGDNELSPECLDGAQVHLKDDGISIPSKSTSYINPIMSPRLMELVRTFEKSSNIRDKQRTYASQSESPYVVYIKRAYHIADPQPLFEFVHPNRSKVIDNSRYKKLKFDVKLDCILTGFAGYFDTVLYNDIILSIHPETHSKGLSSWFSMFFPISEPMKLKKGDVIELNFWRCISTHQVWYEWNVSAPEITHIHNHTGRHYVIYK